MSIPPLLFLVLVTLAACAGKPPPQAPCETCPPVESQAQMGDAAVARGAELVEQACACETVECILKVNAEVEALVMPIKQGLQVVVGLGQCKQADAKISAAAITEMEQLRDDACACRDAACADEVQVRFGEFMERYKSSRGSEEQAEQAGKLAEQMMTCLVAARGD